MTPPASVAVASSPDARYPGPADSFSPSERYPEYAQGALARAPNTAYALLRELFAQARLDAEHFGTPSWNPLGAYVPRGARVFVLCNFVYHRRPGETEHTFQSKCIHGSVLRALIDYALLAAGPEGRVRFGNAPLQSCDWERVQQDSGARAVEAFYRERGLPVEARDLRLLVRSREATGAMTTRACRDAADGVEIDLDGASLLAELPERSGRETRFRVSDYDPRRTHALHSGGRHLYVVNRELLEADVVIHLSKLKTHEKVGITCGLKGFVGGVGHKDSLAHHRFGSPSMGGDEYPDRFRALGPLSRLHEWVYSRGERASLQALLETGDRVLRTLARRCGAITTGAWWGNDTAWRMALDLARIFYHADASGVMHTAHQRRHLALIDGIVAGEGNGPLDPTPADTRTLVFSDDVAAADHVACRLMGWSPRAIPLLARAQDDAGLDISGLRPGEPVSCLVNGRPCSDAELAPALGRPFVPPDGWQGRV
jgi:hypothetical protein